MVTTIGVFRTDMARLLKYSVNNTFSQQLSVNNSFRQQLPPTTFAPPTSFSNTTLLVSPLTACFFISTLLNLQDHFTLSSHPNHILNYKL